MNGSVGKESKRVFRLSAIAWMLILIIMATLMLTVMVLKEAEELQISRLGENLALGKPCALSPQPNYSHTTEPGDAVQLTDGEYTTGRFWTQTTTVGWKTASPVMVTIDLGNDYPIKGLSLNTAAGTAEVHWPTAIQVLVSKDGQAWYPVGELIELSNRHSPLPPYGTYQTRRLWTDQLETHGQFVALVIEPDGKYIFADEIEVFRGIAHRGYSGRPAVSVSAYVTDTRLQEQLFRDLEAVEADIETLPDESRADLTSQLGDLTQAVHEMPHVPMEGFRATLPMTELEREIFELQAAVWRSQGKPLLRVWQKHRWDPLGPSEEPEADDRAAAVEVHMMDNEYRSDVFNLTNAADSAAVFYLRIVGLPGGENPTYVQVREVLSVGTPHAAAVAAALPEAELAAQGYVITVPAGMTRQVWLGFHPTGFGPGMYAAKVEIRDEAGIRAILPIRLQIYPLRFPDQTTLLVGGWSYTNQEDKYDITPQNRLAVIAHLQEHYVNAPWATKLALGSGTYDETGEMVEPPDTTNFDQWVALWPNAKMYMVFSAVKESFAGAESGTPLFNARVGNWARFWAEHMGELGLSASQLGILLVDEPATEEEYDRVTAWAKAIKAAAPDLVIWEDPLPTRNSPSLQAMMANVDVLCAKRRTYLTEPKWYQDLFLDQRSAGRELCFFDSDGPTPRLDPYSYYLLQGWHSFEIGAKGSAFWAFGDNGGASSWNVYPPTVGQPYTPLYLDDTSVTGSKYMEAIREGIEDYEYLIMLRTYVEELKKRGAMVELASAQELLESAADRVLASEAGATHYWDQEKDRSQADQVRVEILEMLAGSGSGDTSGKEQ